MFFFGIKVKVYEITIFLSRIDKILFRMVIKSSIEVVRRNWTAGIEWGTKSSQATEGPGRKSVWIGFHHWWCI